MPVFRHLIARKVLQGPTKVDASYPVSFLCWALSFVVLRPGNAIGEDQEEAEAEQQPRPHHGWL